MASSCIRFVLGSLFWGAATLLSVVAQAEDNWRASDGFELCPEKFSCYNYCVYVENLSTKKIRCIIRMQNVPTAFGNENLARTEFVYPGRKSDACFGPAIGKGKYTVHCEPVDDELEE